MLRSIDIPAAFVFPVVLLLLLLQMAVTSVWGTLPFGNRNGDSGAAGGFVVGGVGGGRRNNPRLPVSPEAYMSSVSYFTFIIPGSYIPTVKFETFHFGLIPGKGDKSIRLKKTKE
ncbi:hypothetical protein DAPPUDRAFT_110774 [Daphnia pulex]|uniref:Uncharacterized protein n=1 Tax=Daphnia pulex TaxID=6669 RepID=E9H6Y3_DAPPU|nr:hypothetical protein DAPPUDRAFT_110774 [Daphnia pulex]|eukprot:EFX72480.1 hypothetical protein DAPPUDRAFT_110774 [Daphnia pulex]